MKKKIVQIISIISFNKIRGQRYFEANPDLRWWWTPWTYRFKHNGWIFLNLKWLWRFRNGIPKS